MKLKNLKLSIFHLKEYIRCSTFKKLSNLLLIKIQRYLRRDLILGMPYKYFIDPINVCNLRCPLCPTGLNILARQKGRLKLEDLKRYVDEISPFAYRIELYNWGEPLLHPEIIEMIEIVSRNHISVGLSSNLNYLTPDMAQKLVESGLNQIVVSVDGATQESYGMYRKNGDLELVLQNLDLLIKTKKNLNRSNPFIIWRMLIGKHNEKEVEMVRKKAKEIGVDFFTTGLLYINTNDSEMIEKWIPLDPKYNHYKDKNRAIKNTWNCNDLWESMVINWDGGISPCCWLHNSQYDFGNVSSRSIREVWNGEYYKSARKAISKKTSKSDITTICHSCRGCPDYLQY